MSSCATDKLTPRAAHARPTCRHVQFQASQPFYPNFCSLSLTSDNLSCSVYQYTIRRGTPCGRRAACLFCSGLCHDSHDVPPTCDRQPLAAAGCCFAGRGAVLVRRRRSAGNRCPRIATAMRRRSDVYGRGPIGSERRADRRPGRSGPLFAHAVAVGKHQAGTRSGRLDLPLSHERIPLPRPAVADGVIRRPARPTADRRACVSRRPAPKRPPGPGKPAPLPGRRRTPQRCGRMRRPAHGSHR
jgi:hypothetical protein